MIVLNILYWTLVHWFCFLRERCFPEFPWRAADFGSCSRGRPQWGGNSTPCTFCPFTWCLDLSAPRAWPGSATVWGCLSRSCIPPPCLDATDMSWTDRESQGKVETPSLSLWNPGKVLWEGDCATALYHREASPTKCKSTQANLECDSSQKRGCRSWGYPF